MLDNFCVHGIYLCYITCFTNLNNIDKLIRGKVFTSICYIRYLTNCLNTKNFSIYLNKKHYGYKIMLDNFCVLSVLLWKSPCYRSSIEKYIQKLVVQYFNRKVWQFYKGYFINLSDEGIEN